MHDMSDGAVNDTESDETSGYKVVPTEENVQEMKAIYLRKMAGGNSFPEYIIKQWLQEYIDKNNLCITVEQAIYLIQQAIEIGNIDIEDSFYTFEG